MAAPPSCDQRQAPLSGDRRLRKRLCDRDPVRLDRLFLGTAPDDAEVRELLGPLLEELRLPALGLEQCDVALRQRRGERDSRRAAATPDVDDRAVEAADELEPRERIVEQDAARLGRIAKRSQPRRRDDGREPAVEEVRPRRGGE